MRPTLSAAASYCAAGEVNWLSCGRCRSSSVRSTGGEPPASSYNSLAASTVRCPGQPQAGPTQRFGRSLEFRSATEPQ